MFCNFNYRKIELLSVVVCVFFIVLLNSCQREPEKLNSEFPEKFYEYPHVTFQKHIDVNGFQNFTIDKNGVSRNSSGTSIRLFDRMSDYYIVIGCNGSLIKYNAPYEAYWLSDNNEIMAYVFEDQMYFPGGHSKTEGSEVYFLKKIEKGLLGIYNMGDPTIMLAKEPYLKGQLFWSGKNLFFFGQERPEQITAITYDVSDGNLNVVEKQKIALPDLPQARIGLVDFNPQTLDLVLIDQFGKHSKSKWYSFNLLEKKYKALGWASDYGFFLQCEILQEN